MLYSILSNRLRQKKAILLSFLALFCVLTAQAQNRIYVSPDGTGDGSSWNATTNLASALAKAQAGDEIWLKGFQQITDAKTQLYVAPKNGWTVPSGVKIYGGFEGTTETNINQRKTLGKAYQMKYRSVLSGDRGVLTDIATDDDVIDPNYSIFPENTTRSDNAKHVLVLNVNNTNGNNNFNPTVLDGLTIAGGNAEDFGGGIYVNGGDASAPYSINRCYLLNNYAPKGGAIYVADNVFVKDSYSTTQSHINQCVVYNNVAGTVIGKENLGGGIYVAGEGNIVNCSVFNNENGGVVLSPDAYLVNTTVARNTGAGVDMAASPSDEEAHVYNSVIWGNSFVYEKIMPVFNYSAYPDAPEKDGKGNINLSKNNQGDEKSPRFDAPSLKTSFDIDYDWRRNAYPLWSWKLREGSYLIDRGNKNFYNVLAGNILTDLGGSTRFVGEIDINAYEFNTVPAARIRYVKTEEKGGSDSNNGQSWETAYASVQKAINDLALSQPGVPGEVWVAAGTYQPTENINGNGTPASFRMYDGISLYGGFAGTETKKSERARENGTMPWHFDNVTILRGSTYDGKNTWNPTDNKWSLTSASTHVVWFAPLPNQADFQNTTVMEGFTIEGGQAKTSEANNYEGDKGAGVYMQGANVYLIHSIVKDNVAPSVGGGIYQKGGRVQGCLVYNNSSETNGGGIYVDNAGLVLRSMITNNSAKNGGGVYLDNNRPQSDGMMHPEYLILSTSIVTNNTSVNNGAVYCNKGGVILQSTIANNNTPTATDNASGNASQTGGLYINEYSTVVNTVLWNNLINGRKVQLYAANPTAENVQFHYSAVSNMNNIVWNNTLQDGLLELSEENRNSAEGVVDPGFVDNEDNVLPKTVGVQGETSDITYFWQPITGSNLRARGMSLGLLPENVLVAPELDITGKLFDQKPAVGAYRVEKTQIEPEKTDSYIRIYVDVESTDPDANGSSWSMAYRSLNEAIDYMAGLTSDKVGNKELQIYVMEGDAWPRYASVNLDPKSATIEVPAMASGKDKKLIIKGGYSRDNHGTWAPLTYRSQINGNHEGKNMEDGLYHCITVENNAIVEFDGFHIINGYAAGTANLKYGAGMLVRDGANVTVKNSIFENNTAAEGAAIDARGATLSLMNCVVNNNTNTTNTALVINCPNLTLNHVSVVNNVGAAPASMGTSSFAAGNTSGNTFEYASVGAEGYKNFANPTNKQGASLGFDTYLGGYSNFAPLTSSAEAGNLINKASGTPAGLDQDIAGNERNLGGAPDLGAYEAALPANGSVIYVTANGAGNMDGSSWENAIAGNLIYDVNKGKVDGNIPTTDARYIGFYDATARPYGETSGASKLFFEHMGEAGVIAGTAVDNVDYKIQTMAVGQWDNRKETHISGANNIKISNNRQERYVGGLQYAVELAATNAAQDGVQRTVWVAGGTYTDYKGFVIRDKVDVLGGFPNVGTPGEDDRQPLISQYIPAKASDVDLDKTKYETIIQIQETKPWTYNSNGNPGANPDAKLPAQTRKPVLFQPDVCLPTKSPSGRESSYTYYKIRYRWTGNDHWNGQEYGNSVPGADETASNTYRYGLPEGEQNGKYVEYRGATWDGFTIRHGFYTDYKANRDGGAGVRMFRGVTLQNCVVTDNYINAHNNAGRGSGIYCDGSNSKVVNCFVLNNANNSDESYGGGMYLILGTSYNTMVANNYAKTNGGGIFIEDAMFYNNTVAFNKSNGTGGLHQWTASSGTKTTLKLYNTVFYGNSNRAIDVLKDDKGNFNFNGAWNCYVQTNSSLDGAVQAKIHDSQIGTGLASPFESANAQTDNNFRLNATTWCLNNGAEDLGNDYQGKPVELPYTDVDFTDRIKDCTVDLGAYERSNEENVKCDDKGFYYVTENGSGTSDGSSLQNAACAMKLQEVLNAAGERAKTGLSAIVKIAGYEGEFGKIFVYNANTLSDPNDPQSYTFKVPYGVTVEGGYDGLKTDSWTEADRNPKKYRTVLSAICNSATLEQEVNGYHTVTFGEKPSDWNDELVGDKTTIIDGLYLIYGKATSMAGEGNPNTRGGGAIVPAWAHVRNCVVAQCEAIQGGGLYLLPGATVSGTLIMENKAEEGAGVYAGNSGASKILRAHMISNTITDNTASEVGGGVYLEDGAVLTTNSVIWGNTAPSDKNVSGVVNSTFEDDKFATVVGGTDVIPAFYPFNHCYVETYEMPSNYENTSMVTDETLYFTADRTLKAYSELVKHGTDTTNYKNLVQVFNVSKKDMQGIARKQSGIGRVDVGAYAFEGGIIPLPKSESDIVKRIFVSQGSNVNLTKGNSADTYIGRSFYTSVSWLDDAIDYIKKVRATYKNVEFEIYLAGGTYKPSNRRTDAGTTTIDQRQNSYVIPAGVKIYGGFKGDETYGYGINSIPAETGDIGLTPVSDDNLKTFLAERKYSDLNGNGINEPWEMANQTILSGDINVSPSVKNAYHVVYSSGSGSVLLDGLTIKDGETADYTTESESQNEVGRGGALYTNGVDYTLKGCRVMNSKAMRGGAIYARDANLTIIGSVIGGNATKEIEGQDVRGGAVYMSGFSKNIALNAINTLWTNNETSGVGGAIATSNDKTNFTGSVSVSLMNNTIVRNKAAEASAVYSVAKTGATGNITNTVMWGGDETGETKGAVSAGLAISYSASDSDLPSTVESENANNVKLNTSNMAIDGPRFALPSSAAGVAANDVASKWNPASISVLTDAGNGQLDYNSSDMKLATGAYKDWVDENMSDDPTFYMGSTGYNRYMGPKPVGQDVQPKTIDIGLFEYQYKTQFLTMDEIYVDTQERGDGSGDSWANATSDLRGAIIALSDPDGGSKTDKSIYIRGGEYPQSQLYVNDIAYQAVLNGNKETLTSLTIRGSYAENGQQDFSQPTVFLPSTAKPVKTMFYAQTNGKKLTIEGITFQNAGTAGFDANNSGTLNLKNVAFRQNGTGANIEGDGATLFANALFADGTTGLSTTSGNNVKVVNATFANNKTAVTGTPAIYNTVAWKSGDDITTDPEKGNINLRIVDNGDILSGPNFVDPDNGNVLLRNYMIRPSIKLIDAAVESHYNKALGDDASTTDKDLGNNARKTGDGMDIGAYEYNAALQQIVYVKSNVAQTDGSGSSWQNPIKDLQSAIDLASVYANKNNEQNGYVFVHRDANVSGIRLNMPNVKVYGGMNDEVVDQELSDDEKAKNLINARTSVLADKMSTINGLTLAGESSVIDGFAVTGTVDVNGGMLSTSVVNGDATVGADGVVYNSYVSGTLSGAGKAVNVTSPVAVSTTSKINVVENAQPNGYVDTDIWKYQLKEDNIAIDNSQNSDIADYITLAGHSKDLSGSKRVRNIVDAGCFESWNITTNTPLGADDMPTNKHVVYVRKGVEADIAAGLYPDGTKFNVGFLLLEHGAGLRSNGNAIKLTNFAVERSLDESNNRWDMCYMPFTIVKTEGAGGVSVKTYDGAARAAYDYQFKAEDGAWIDTDLQGGKGLLLQSEADATLRMYGEEYTEEAGQSKQVQLARYNNMQPWDSNNSGTSLKFTHLENMSWNMFGSPFLCAMNYDDMEYGRVIYKKGGNTYTSENTADEKVSGSIEAGSAVFTQTATLKDVENFYVKQPTSEVSGQSTRTRLAVAVAPQGQGEQDELTLTAVPTEEASDQFNMAADGVKMMTVGKAAQIYLERGGKHYSMLTALDLEGKIDVGVLVPETGLYTVYIPEDCPMDDYETVVLEDKTNGRMVDLLEGGYDFQMNEAGTLNSRFTLSFNRELAEQGLTRIRIQAMGNGQVRITGLMDGDQITAYQENGTMTYSQRVASAEKNIALPGKVCLIKVVAADGSEIVKKLVIR